MIIIPINSNSIETYHEILMISNINCQQYLLEQLEESMINFCLKTVRMEFGCSHFIEYAEAPDTVKRCLCI